MTDRAPVAPAATPVRSLLRRLLAASASEVAPGGESGPWQWLLPALVVVVTAFGGLSVHRSATAAGRATDRATQAAAVATIAGQSQALATASVATHGDDPSVVSLLNASMRRLVQSYSTLERSTPGDPLVGSLGSSVDAVMAAVHGISSPAARTPSVRSSFARLASFADGTQSDLEMRARAARSANGTRTALALGGGLLLVGLLMWTFWAKRTRLALADSERRFHADRTEMRDKLRWQAFHDTLTGLPNRSLFEDRVAHALERLRRRTEEVAVLFIDLDDFKTVNDSLGHAVGDGMLREFAMRLSDCVRRVDTAARFGGDEFVVLVEGSDAAWAAHEVAQRVHECVEHPVDLEVDELFMHVSIGIAIGKADMTADELIRNADIAMYAAKSKGKRSTAAFEPSMHDAARKRLQLSGDLRRALRNGELSVHYQPLLRLTDDRIIGAEALARWMHPTLGVIPPADFIPLAEETGLIVQIGRHVLGEACRQLRTWQDSYPDEHPDYVSVNLSVRQFQPEGQVVEDVIEATRAAGIDPSQLMLEVTESIIMADPEPMIRDLTALRQLGAKIAIDDFGTGYSALSYLRHFPIDTVKMDRSFVHDMGNGKADSALIRSVVELGVALDMQIVAEGIELQNQLESVTDMHCDIGQGYIFYPPLDADAMRLALGEVNARAAER